MNNSRLVVRGALATLAMVVSGIMGPAVAATEPAPGETYIYRLINGYNKEVLGQLHYRVEKVDPGSYTVLVSPDNSWGGVERTQVYTKDGNWLRHPLDSHGQKVEYQFASAYPAYAFPLEVGKSWSVRVNATVPGAPQVRSVRVDGTVLGRERVRVPAGEFDTIKIRRLIYPGDAYYSLPETRIIEIDWYAPALGRAVRTETRSEYLDLSRCHEESSCVYHGPWDVVELITPDAARR